MVMETEAKLEAHERECAIRYATVQDKLDGLDKRLWRLEAMVLAAAQRDTLATAATADTQTVIV